MEYRIDNFRGIDQSIAENALSQSFSPDACNMETENGDLAVAKGYVKHIATAVPGSDPIRFMHVWRKTGSDHFIVGAGQKIYHWTGTVWEDIYTYSDTLTSTSWDVLETRIGNDNYIIIANGQTQLIKWSGTGQASLFGSGAYVHETTVASVTYNMTKATTASYAVSDGTGTYTLTMPAGWAYSENQEISFTIPQTIASGVNAIAIAIGGGTYALNYVPAWIAGDVAVAKLTSPTAASVSLTDYGVTTVTLTAAIPEAWTTRALNVGVQFNGVTRLISAVSSDRLTVTLKEPCTTEILAAQTAKVRGEISDQHVGYLELYGSRLFSAGDPSYPSRLYWSQPPGDTRTIEDWSMDEYSEVSSGGHVEVGATSSDPICGLCALPNQLVIFKQNSIYRLIGTTPSDFRVVQVNISTETMSNMGFILYESTPFWLTNAGLYYHDGSNAKLSGNARQIRKILSSADLSRSKGCTCKDRMYFTCRLGSGNVDDSIIVYNFVEKTYMLRNGFTVIDLCTSNGLLYLINSKRYVYQFENGLSYDGDAINAYWNTPKTDMQQKAVAKTLKSLYLRGTGDVVLLSYSVGNVTQDERWLIPETEEETLRLPLRNLGRTFCMKISNEGGGYFCLKGGIEIQLDGRYD